MRSVTLKQNAVGYISSKCDELCAYYFHFAIVSVNSVEMIMLQCKWYCMSVLAVLLCLTGECSMVDITFANNVSVIPSSPSQLRPTAVLRERNLPQPPCSCRLRHVTVEQHLIYYVDEE